MHEQFEGQDKGGSSWAAAAPALTPNSINQDHTFTFFQLPIPGRTFQNVGASKSDFKQLGNVASKIMRLEICEIFRRVARDQV